MRDRKAVWLVPLFTALVGVAGAAIWGSIHVPGGEDPLKTSLRMGIVFASLFAAGFTVMHLTLRFAHCKVQLRRHWLAIAAACAVLIFAVGAGGQYLYMFSREEIVHTTIVEEEVDLVLLLDASSSMDSYGYSDVRTNAAVQFVDSLSEDVQLQAMTFGGSAWCLDKTAMEQMDSDGKVRVNEYIAAIDSVGNTNFDGGLGSALDTLVNDSAVRQDSSKAVILLTDGDENHILTDTYFQSYLDLGIRLFTVRINNSDYVGNGIQMLIDFAISTGGSDTRIVPRDDGTIDVQDMLDAFQDAFQAASYTETEIRRNFSDDLLVYTGPVGFAHHLVRTAALVLIGILFGIGYFGTIDVSKMILNALTGLVLSFLAAAMGTGSGLTLNLILSALVLVPAFLQLKETEEGSDV